MREKKVNEHSVNKTLEFLNKIYYNVSRREFQHSISYWMEYFKIARNTALACEELNIFNRVTDKVQTWVGEQPSRHMAIMVIDRLLHKNKKIVHVPILPDYASAISSISTNLEQIQKNISETNTILGRIKTNRITRGKELPAILSEQVHGETLFTEADKRFQLIKALAPAFFAGIMEAGNSTEKIEKASKKVIQAADYLLNLSKVEQPTEQPNN